MHVKVVGEIGASADVYMPQIVDGSIIVMSYV